MDGCRFGGKDSLPYGGHRSETRYAAERSDGGVWASLSQKNTADGNMKFGALCLQILVDEGRIMSIWWSQNKVMVFYVLYIHFPVSGTQPRQPAIPRNVSVALRRSGPTQAKPRAKKP